MTGSEKSLNGTGVRPRVRHQAGQVCLDIGSHTTKVFVDDRTIVLYPSCFIRHVSTGAVLVIGEKVIKMMGKLPADVSVVFPVRNGQVVDTEAFQQFTKAILSNYIPSDLLSFFRPVKLKSALLYPDHETQRMVLERTLRQHSYRVKLAPMSSALWSLVVAQRIYTTQGCVIDIGGMTTKIYLFAEGQLSGSTVVEFGGDAWTMDIIQTLRQECHLEVGWITAEELKRVALHLGSREHKHTVQGKDVVTGLPVTKVISDQIFVKGATKVVERVIQAFEDVCQNATPELVSKILERGVYLTGGGSQLPGLGSVLQQTLKLPVCVSQHPQEDVVRGLAIEHASN